MRRNTAELSLSHVQAQIALVEEWAENMTEALNAQIRARRALEQDLMVIEVPGAGCRETRMQGSQALAWEDEVSTRYLG